MTSTTLFNVKSAAIDGRLRNLRVRHEALRKLSEAVKRHRSDLEIPITRTNFEAALEQVLANIAQHASKLDLQAHIAHAQKLSKPGNNAVTHVDEVGVGLIALRLGRVEELQFPLDALFGPLTAAIAAGNTVVVLANQSPLVRTYETILFEALQRDTFVFLDESQLSEKDCQAFDLFVSFGDDPRATLKVPRAGVQNIVVIDHSCVDERLYRHPEKHARTVRHQVAKVNDFASQIKGFPGEVAHVFASETIANHLPSSLKATPIKSIADGIAEIERLSQAAQTNLFVFADANTAAFYARQSATQSVSINAMPQELGLGYVPTSSSTRIADDGQHLEPLWSTDLFTAKRATLAFANRRRRRDVKRLDSQTTIAPLKRGHPDHWEFFPTGFKITFFPLALSMLGGLGFGAVRLSMYAWRALHRD